MIFLYKENVFLRTFFVLILSCFFFISCDTNRVFDTTIKIENRNWDETNKINFAVDVEDTLSYYNMYINIRNTDQYKFSNLYLFMTTKYPRQYFARDTLQLNLAADDGRWLGSGLGDLFYNQVLFKPKFKFPQKGIYTFELQQGMRVNPLPGIADVGIRVEKVK